MLEHRFYLIVFHFSIFSSRGLNNKRSQYREECSEKINIGTKKNLTINEFSDANTCTLLATSMATIVHEHF